MSWFKRFALALLLLMLFAIACGGIGDTSSPSIGQRASAVTTGDQTITISLPASVPIDAPILAANGTLAVDDRVTVHEAAPGPASAVNAGAQSTNIGADTLLVGNLTSIAATTLRDRAQVTGTVISGGTITPGNADAVDGGLHPNALVSTTTVSWTVHPPATNNGTISLEPSEQRSIAPGGYGDLVVKSGAKLFLQSGAYFATSLDLEPDGQLVLDKSTGPIAIYVQSSIIFRGLEIDQGGAEGDFLLVYLGTAAASIEAPFTGTVVAPNASLNLASLSAGYFGQFFAKDLEAQPGSSFTHVAFDWRAILGASDTGTGTVVPIVECVRQLGPTSYIASFGYLGRGSAPISIDVGSGNSFAPTPQQRSQPTTFFPGRHQNVFTVAFDGTPLSWIVGNNSAQASNTSPRCSSDPQHASRIPATFRIVVPLGYSPETVTLGASNDLALGDSVQIGAAQGSGNATSLGTTAVGNGDNVQDIVGKTSVVVGSGSTVAGNALSEGTVTLGLNDDVQGAVRPNTMVTPPVVLSWGVSLPASPHASFHLTSGKTKILFPGTYGDLVLDAGATVYMKTGYYYFRSVSTAAGSLLSLDDHAGPVQVYITDGLFLAGSARQLGGADPELLFGYSGSMPAVLAGPVNGVVVAPDAAINLGPLSGGPVIASVFARTIHVASGTTVRPAPFGWDRFRPFPEQTAKPLTFPPSPVVLVASHTYNPEAQQDGTATPASPVVFEIPDRLLVNAGNAGNGTAKLTYTQPNGVVVTCTYQGGSSTPTPETQLDRAAGREYMFKNCSNGAAVNAAQTGTTFRLSVNGDPNATDGALSVRLALGVGGCSGTLGQPIPPAESMQMFQSFSWDNTQPLPETNPDGTPTLFYANIYITNKDELGLLDRLLIHHQNLPLFDSELQRFQGKCGTMSYVDDGQGVFVFAVIPGMTYNKIREAIFSDDVDPNGRVLFKAIVLRDAPAAAKNPDGSLSYDALEQAGFYYMGLRDLPDDGAIDAEVMPLGSVSKTLVSALRFVEGAAEFAARTAMKALAFIDRLLQGSVKVHIQTDVMNVAPQFDPTSPMIRAWGPGAGSPLRMGGLRVEVRQWMQRIYTLGIPLPTLYDGETDDNGYVTIKVAKGGDGFGGATSARGDSAICVHLDTDAAVITSFLTADDFCEFNSFNLGSPTSDPSSVFGDFTDDVNVHLRATDPELNGLNQMQDVFTFDRDVLGIDLDKPRVMTGFNANVLSHRSWTPCLNLHSFVPDTIALTEMGIIGASSLLGPAGLITATALSTYLAILTTTDIFMRQENVEQSREVMSHEYGHFTLCNLIEHSPNSSTLDSVAVESIFEGEQTGSETRFLNEAFADFITGQVVSGANYHWLQDDASDVQQRFCDQPGKNGCFDFNFSNRDSYVSQIARNSSTFFDAFDGHSKGDLAPTNADAWGLSVIAGASCPNTDGKCLVYTPNPYGDLKDEAIVLPGSDVGAWFNQFGANATFGDPLSEEPLDRALAQVMYNDGYSWCQVCRLFALHVGVPTSASAHAFWNACVGTNIQNEIGPAPESSLRMDAATCSTCRDGFISNDQGQCVSCGPRDIASGDACVTCAPGTISSNNVCVACSSGTISVGNVCMSCGSAQTSAQPANVCTDCTVDATVNATTLNGCGTGIASTSAPGDLCSDRFVVQLQNVSDLLGDTSNQGVIVSVRPTMAIQDEAICEATTATVAVVAPSGTGWQTIASSSAAGVFTPAPPCNPGDTVCLAATCTFGGAVTLPRAAFNQDARVIATLTSNGTTVPSTVDLRIAGRTCAGPH